MRRPKHHIQPKTPPDGMTPSREAREVLAYVVGVTLTPVQPHGQSNPPEPRDDGCGPLFASRLLHVLRTRQSLPHPGDPEAYHLVALYSAALDVKMIGRGSKINPDNTTTQECRIIAGLEKLRFDLKKLKTNTNTKNPYENFADYARVARLRPMPWVDGSDPELKRARRTSTKPTPETRSILDTVSKASKSNPTPIPARPGSSTVREPDDKRILQEMYRISADDLKRYVKAFSSDHLPEEFCVEPDGDPITLAYNGDPEPITIPHPLYNIRSPVLPKLVGLEEDVRNWVRTTVLETVQRILNVYDPATSAWSFGPVHGQGTLDLRSDFAWKCNLGQGTDVDVVHRLIVEVKAPWVMRTKDFNEFVAIGKLRKASEITAEVRANNNGVIPTDKDGSPVPPTFKKVENVWAQIYDYCTRQKHHFFVLTSYENWVFGVFSLGYELAYVSEVIPYDNIGPTVLECLLYWVQSAMFVPGLFEIPRLSASGKILPTVWELAVERWRSHGYNRIEAAIEASTKLQAATNPSVHILSKNPQMDALRKYLESFYPTHHQELSSEILLPDDRYEHFETPSRESGSRVLQKLLQMPVINVALAAAWLALCQWPSDLIPEYGSLAASLVAVTMNIDGHPINNPSVIEHVKLTEKYGKRTNITILSREWRTWCPVVCDDGSRPALHPPAETRPPIAGREVIHILEDFSRGKMWKRIEPAATAFWEWRQSAASISASDQLEVVTPTPTVQQEGRSRSSRQSDPKPKSGNSPGPIQSSRPTSVTGKRSRRDAGSRQGSGDSVTNQQPQKKRAATKGATVNKVAPVAASSKPLQGKGQLRPRK